MAFFAIYDRADQCATLARDEAHWTGIRSIRRNIIFPASAVKPSSIHPNFRYRRFLSRITRIYSLIFCGSF